MITLVNLVVYILVLGLVLWLLQYLINYLPMPEPFRRIANIVLVVIGVVLLIGLLLSLVGEGGPIRLPRVGSATGVIATGYAAVTNFLAKAVAAAGLQFAPAFRKRVFIEAVSLARAEAVLDDGTILPIVNWFDSEGEECDRTDAVVAVAGSNWLGWTAIDLEDFTFDTTLQ